MGGLEAMRNLRRALATSLLMFAFVGNLPAPAVAAANNVTVVTNTKDGSFVWKQSFKITRVNGDTVDQVNAAVATASCEQCRTAAVAFHVVLATGEASNVGIQNIAFAFNEGCNLCATYAGAYQLLITTHDQVHFTESGSAQIDQIKLELQTLIAGATFGPTEPGDDPIDLSEIMAFDREVSALFDRLEAVVRSELVRSGGGQVDEVVEVDLAA
jgi:hypothetical protein